MAQRRLICVGVNHRSCPVELREKVAFQSDGIEVALWWNRISGDLTVSVRDRMTGDSFDVPAARHDALDVFNHPYAYAA